MSVDIPPTPHELTPGEREEIATELRRLEKSNSGPYPIRCFSLKLTGRPVLFNKHCYDDAILAEAHAQHFFYGLAKDDKSAPRIPRVVDAFSTEDGHYSHFLVMEKIDALTLDSPGISQERAVELAARAVKWLQDQLSSVPDTIFGRISREDAPVWHSFFYDHQAPAVFANAQELAEYISGVWISHHLVPKTLVTETISQASQVCRGKHNRLSTDQVLGSLGDHRRIYHSDIKKENFLVNAQGVWIVDFEHIGVFPEVFQTCSFFNTCTPFACEVGSALGYRPSDAANALGPIMSVLQQCGGMSKQKASKYALPGKL